MHIVYQYKFVYPSKILIYLPPQTLSPYVCFFGITQTTALNQYEKHGVTVICTNEKQDMIDINAALERKLKTFKKGIVNFKE